MDVCDDDGQLHGAAAVSSVRRHDLLVDPGRLHRTKVNEQTEAMLLGGL